MSFLKFLNNLCWLTTCTKQSAQIGCSSVWNKPPSEWERRKNGGPGPREWGWQQTKQKHKNTKTHESDAILTRVCGVGVIISVLFSLSFSFFPSVLNHKILIPKDCFTSFQRKSLTMAHTSPALLRLMSDFRSLQTEPPEVLNYRVLLLEQTFFFIPFPLPPWTYEIILFSSKPLLKQNHSNFLVWVGCECGSHKRRQPVYLECYNNRTWRVAMGRCLSQNSPPPFF